MSPSVGVTSQRIFDAIGAQLILHRNFADTAPRVGDEYEIAEILGAGGFGLICRATQLALRRPVALKLFPLDGGDDRGVREALREARSLARLEHPGIVTVHAAGESELIAGERLACAYVEMQLIDGADLRDWLAADERDANEVLTLLCTAGRALAHAHASGILHRDFKPENLMIDRSGRPTVIDFGLALVAETGVADPVEWNTGSDAIGSRATSAGMVRGTPRYMAPEAVRGQPRAASDQYALAVVIREALTGRHPLASDTEASGPVPRGGPELFARIKPLLDRAMAASPNDRFASVDALCDALETMPRAQPVARRGWRLAIVAGLLGVAGITAGLLGLAQQPKHDDAVGEQHRCSTEPADARPFVVGWDATELSTFASIASRDLVFVRYADCELELLLGCSDDGVPGRYGSYHSPFFTEGAVESLELHNLAELDARLPLGAASFRSTIEDGETLELRYYVSGTVNGTRNHVSRATLRDNPRCEGATHFVSAYNLGAFRLFASGDESSNLAQGGDLDGCLTHGQQRCRVPLRLVLQPIDETAPAPESRAAAASAPRPEPTGATDAERVETLHEHALDKRDAGDGPGCLEELDRIDDLHVPEEERPHLLSLRGQCTMLAGDCKAGAEMLREAIALYDTDKSASDLQIIAAVAKAKSEYCPLDQINESTRGSVMFERTRDASHKQRPEVCRSMGEAALAMIEEQREANEKPDDYAMETLLQVIECLWRNGDCDGAKVWYIESELQWGYGKPEAKLRAKAEEAWVLKRKETGCRN